MHDSHLSVRLWFWAAYWVTTHTPGISAVQLQRQLGIAGYGTNRISYRSDINYVAPSQLGCEGSS